MQETLARSLGQEARLEKGIAPLQYSWTYLVAQTVKNLPAIWETGSIPGLEGPLEKGIATHSSVLAWRAPWTEEPGRLRSPGLQRVRHG